MAGRSKKSRRLAERAGRKDPIPRDVDDRQTRLPCWKHLGVISSSTITTARSAPARGQRKPSAGPGLTESRRRKMSAASSKVREPRIVDAVPRNQ